MAHSGGGGGGRGGVGMGGGMGGGGRGFGGGMGGRPGGSGMGGGMGGGRPGGSGMGGIGPRPGPFPGHFPGPFPGRPGLGNGGSSNFWFGGVPYYPWNNTWLPGNFWINPLYGAPYQTSYPFPANMVFTVGMTATDSQGNTWRLVSIQGAQYTWVLVSSTNPALTPNGASMVTYSSAPQ